MMPHTLEWRKSRRMVAIQRRSSQTIKEKSALITIIVVTGMKSRMPGRSITMSPGSRPRGSLRNHGQDRETAEDDEQAGHRIVSSFCQTARLA
jgi:hypothetical protein